MANCIFRPIVKAYSGSNVSTYWVAPWIGEKYFVDYGGSKVSIINGSTGEIREAQIFVTVLGASNSTFAEATWTQSLPDWLSSHVRVLTHFGG